MKNKKTRILVSVIILIVLAYVGYTKYYSIGDVIKSNRAYNQTISSLNVSDFKKEFEQGDKILIDIRTQEELDTFGKIQKDALHIDFYADDFAEQLDKLDKTKKYLIYCYHGNRSKGALDAMRNLGFEYVKDLNGGIDAWINNGEKVFK